MLKLTKKGFKVLHENDKLLLIGSYNFKKEVILKELNKLDKIYTIKTSRIDVNNVKGYSVINVYREDNYIFVESVITCDTYGNSINTVCYLLK